MPSGVNTNGSNVGRTDSAGMDQFALPLYGFVEGDTLGVLIFAEATDSVGSLAIKLRDAASVRVEQNGELVVVYKGAQLDPNITIREAGLRPLERFDLRSKWLSR
jgi:hypothetical protein